LAKVALASRSIALALAASAMVGIKTLKPTVMTATATLVLFFTK
jgi:hypothetical protein